MRSADMTFVASSHERDLLAKLVPDAEVMVLPTAHVVADVVPPSSGRAGQLFVGGFAHDPNVDAALRLGRDIMPGLREELAAQPRCRLWDPTRPPRCRRWRRRTSR